MLITHDHILLFLILSLFMKIILLFSLGIVRLSKVLIVGGFRVEKCFRVGRGCFGGGEECGRLGFFCDGIIDCLGQGRIRD